MDFQTILTGVRPARVAVLIDKTEPDWANSTLRSIEFLCQVWGGEHALLIPTDGNTIDQTFWDLLTTFDPDYMYWYQRTGKDDQIADPTQFQAAVDKQVADWMALYRGTDKQTAQSQIEGKLLRLISKPFGITDNLKREIVRRVVPFNYKAHLTGSIIADATPCFPLTAIHDLIRVSEFPRRVTQVRQSSGTLPFLWFASVCGSLTKPYVSKLEDSGVKIDITDFDDEQIGRLIHLVVAAQADLHHVAYWWKSTVEEIAPFKQSLPFASTMVHLSRYRSVRFEYWNQPVIGVAGNTLEDFCLFFNLSRLRERVVWILPSITDKALNGDCEPQYNGPEFHFVTALDALSSPTSQHEGGTLLLSRSLTEQQLQSLRTCISTISGGNFESTIKIGSDVREFIKHPFAVYETGNVDRDQTKIVVEEELPGLFETPKPKSLTTIIPSQHRWITELRFAKYHMPQHESLAEHVVTSQQFSAKETRMSTVGPAYFSPGPFISGGEEIDRLLVRPQLRKPSPESIIEIIAKAGGIERCAISDKGFYSDESIRKFGGLEETARIFRDAPQLSLLNKFLDAEPNKAGVFDEGTRLSIDRRRYLNLPCIQKIVGDKDSSVRLIDDLVAKSVLLRGFILKCRYCRNADWFALSNVGQSFDCKRCGRQQVLKRENWLGSDAANHEPSLYYKLDEIVYQGLTNDMHVPILTLDALRKRSAESFIFVPEMWFFKAGTPWIESDIICIVDGILTLGEVKSADRIEKTSKDEAASLKKYKDLATALQSRSMVFATARPAWSAGTMASISEAFKDAETNLVILTQGDLFQ